MEKQASRFQDVKIPNFKRFFLSMSRRLGQNQKLRNLGNFEELWHDFPERKFASPKRDINIFILNGIFFLVHTNKWMFTLFYKLNQI